MLTNFTIVRDYDASPKALAGTISNLETLITSNCDFTLKRKEGTISIYDIVSTSLTTYENMVMSNELDKIRNTLSNKNLTLKRKTKLGRYFVEDSTFPLYRGLYCLRDSYCASRGKIKYVTTQEINIYRNYIQLVYIYEKAGHMYDEQTVRSLYTEFEYNFLLPELLASLCIGIISAEESALLIDLLKRDPILCTDIQHIEQLVDISQGSAVTIYPTMPHLSPINLHSPTVIDVLQHQACMYLTPLYLQVINICSSNNEINVKAVSDFRLIVELERDYNVIDIQLNIYNANETPSSIKIESFNSVEFSTKVKELIISSR